MFTASAANPQEINVGHVMFVLSAAKPHRKLTHYARLFGCVRLLQTKRSAFLALCVQRREERIAQQYRKCQFIVKIFFLRVRILPMSCTFV